MRWRALSSELLFRELDGELAVRNDATASTHLLDALAAEVLRTLVGAGRAVTAAELAARLSAGAEEEDWSRSIESVLQEFERLGLAERAD